MKKINLVLSGVISLFCISGQTPYKSSEDVAATNETSNQATEVVVSQEPIIAASVEQNSWLSREAPSKSAAQKVVSGTSNNSMSGKRRSAAQIARQE